MPAHSPAKRTFYVRTFGCKVNQYETQAIKESLRRAGYVETRSRETADICIVNTCTVTASADKEARYYLNLLGRINPRARIVLTGCLASSESVRDLPLPEGSHIVTNEEKPRMAAIISGDQPSCGDEPFSISSFEDRTRAFLKIQDGCDNFCAYCKIPYVRSRLSSRPLDAIRRELGVLAGNGYKEIVLTCICLGAWGKETPGDRSIVDVLRMADGLPGDFRIRLSSIELKYVTGALIEQMARGRRTCPHLHIPLQSGDDDMLRKMNRPYSADAFCEAVAAAQNGVPGLALTTDVIVGFPGETDAQFRNTLHCLERVAPLRSHVFTFSPREGTAAYRMGRIPAPRVAKERHMAVAALAKGLSEQYCRRLIGTDLDVLVESRRDRKTGMLCGYAGNYVRALFEGPDDLPNTVVTVNVNGLTTDAVVGMRVR